MSNSIRDINTTTTATHGNANVGGLNVEMKASSEQKVGDKKDGEVAAVAKRDDTKDVGDEGEDEEVELCGFNGIPLADLNQNKVRSMSVT